MFPSCMQIVQNHLLPGTITLKNIQDRIATGGSATFPSLGGIFWSFRNDGAQRPAVVDPRANATPPLLPTLFDLNTIDPSLWCVPVH
jgi:hypothetical protein